MKKWITGFASLAVAFSATLGYAVPVTYQLPKVASGEKTYLVSLSIVDTQDPNWIVSTFVAGKPVTVTPGNNTFTDEWDGLDENFMPVPPGTYGVKGIYTPAAIWPVDGKAHAITASWHSGVGGFLPPKDTPEVWKIPMMFHGDPVNSPMRDVDVTPEGIAVFYYQYLENGKNTPMFDLTKKLGPEQFIRAHASGGAGGGPAVATDGETVWACSTDGSPGFVYRADAKPFGVEHAKHRRNVYLTQGVVTGMAAWRDTELAESFVYVVEGPKHKQITINNNRIRYVPHETERIDLITVLAGANGELLGQFPVPRPLSVVARKGWLYVLSQNDGAWDVIGTPIVQGLPKGTWKTFFRLPAGKDPADMEVDGDGRFYVSFPKDNKVRQYDAAGKELRSFGRLDVQPSGGYDNETLMEPAKLGVWKDPDGATRLIIVENAGPNRASEWNADTGAFMRDYATYQTKANNGYAHDPANPEHIYLPGHNEWLVRWKVDYEKGTWAVDAVWPNVKAGQRTGLDKPTAVRVNGRLYLASEQNMTLYRMSDDGKQFIQSAGLVRRQEGTERKDYLWNDENGNGEIDEEELRHFEPLPEGWILSYHGEKWLDDLTYIAATQHSKHVWSLSPSGFDAHGNPIFTEWVKVLTDPMFDAIDRGNPESIRGGNELANTFSSDWAQVNRGEDGSLYVQARGGKGPNANEGAQYKVSRYVRNAAGEYQIQWRVGRAQIVGGRGPGHLMGAMRIFPAYNGIVSVIDQTRSGVVLYTDDGIYIDTLFPPGDTREEIGVYRQPGEFFAGTVYPNAKNGKFYYASGKYTPFLYEINEWTMTDNPVRRLEGLPKTVELHAKDIASPPEIALTLRGGSGSAKLATFSPAMGGAAWDGSMEGWESANPVVYKSGADKTVEVRCLYVPDGLLLRYAVRLGGHIHPRPMPPVERVFTHDQQADTVSFYFQGDPNAQPTRSKDGRPGDVRVIFGLFEKAGKLTPVAVGFYPTWKGSASRPRDAGSTGTSSPTTAQPQSYRSPVGQVNFDHVAEVPGIRLEYAIDADEKGFVLVAGIPRAALLQDKPFSGEFSTMVNFDANLGGHDRFWWANSDGSADTETYDEPSEARLCPGSWAPARFEGLGDGIVPKNWLVLGPFGGPGAEQFNSNPQREAKDQVEAMYEKREFPPDNGIVDLNATFSGEMTQGWWPAPRPFKWTPATLADLDKRVAVGSGAQVWYGATWIYAPKAVEVEVDFLSHVQTFARWRWNNEEFPIATREYAQAPFHLHARVVTKPIMLKAGWNQVFWRSYCVGYAPLRMGIVIKANEDILWQLKFSGTPPK